MWICPQVTPPSGHPLVTFLEPEILLRHPQNVSDEVNYTGSQDEGTNNGFSSTYVVCM